MKIRSISFFMLLNCVFAAGLYAQTAKTFADNIHGYTVSYPSDFKVLIGPKAKSETAFGDPGTGAKLVKITPASIPVKYHGYYEFNVWRSNSPKAKCEAPTAEEENGSIPIAAPESEKTKMIAGHTFYAYNGGDGGMSKSLGLWGYRGMVGGKCWQIQSMSYQVSAFDDYKTFDDKIIAKAFETFVGSFKFLK